MIILGDKYQFTDIEMERLRAKFRHINHISYRDAPADVTIEKIQAYLEENQNTLIVLNTKVKLPDTVLTYLTKLDVKGIKYKTIENFLESHLSKCYISRDDSKNAFLEDIHGYTKWQSVQKFVVNVLGAFVLAVAAWFFAIITYFKIRKESPGKLFFVQERIGKKGKPFSCLKLRTMHPGAEENGAQFAQADDQRVYPWGKVLRGLKGDETPQVYNMLMGKMHLVGPRPERQVWIDMFEKSIPFYAQRHVVSPGITGLAQIKYPYGSTVKDAEQKLMYDLYYIKHWSIWLEITIIWKTIIFVMTHRKKNMANF